MTAQAAEAEHQAAEHGHIALVVDRPGHIHLDRVRRHTARSLARLQCAHAAPRRRWGHSAGAMPPELAAQMPCWLSRDRMLAHVDWLADQPELRKRCRERGVALELWKAATINDVLDADIATGRNMRTSQVVAAAQVGRSEKQIQRIRRINVELGIAVEYFRGYQMSGDERRQLVQERPGHQQRGKPNIYAMGVFPARQRRRISIPRPGCYAQVEANVHLPACTYLSLPTHLPGPLSFATTLPKCGSLRSPSGPDCVRTAPMKKRRPPPGRALAIALVKAMPVLGSEAVNRLQYALNRFAEARPVWDEQDLQHGFQTVRERHGRPGAPVAGEIHTPWAYALSLLAELDEHHDHPRLPFVEPAELRCGRPECDHGWIADVEDHVRELLGLQRCNSQRRCDQCRPGAWPDYRSDSGFDEQPW